jgi:hypothetical protein
MSIFKQVDDRGRIWQVRDLLTDTLAQELITADWSSLPWNTSRGQESWLRRSVNWNDPTAQRLGQYITQQLPVINQALGTKFVSCSGHFWIDLPGFTVDMHTDGHVPNAMQLYWLTPGPDYGTGFYRYNNKNSLLYQFASDPNTGYIILNHLNEDGSQPLYWHGMFNPVPAGTVRVSSYWYFNN